MTDLIHTRACPSPVAPARSNVFVKRKQAHPRLRGFKVPPRLAIAFQAQDLGDLIDQPVLVARPEVAHDPLPDVEDLMTVRPSAAHPKPANLPTFNLAPPTFDF
jgi:hypothetical protein